MTKLHRTASPDIDRLTGYLAAAQHAFIKGQYNVSLDATCFDIVDATVTDEDIIIAAYSDFNPIDHRGECSLEAMIAGVHETLTLPRQMWSSDYCNIPNIVESNLRDGYWLHVKACFDYTNARIVELGWDVPFVNIGGGFTYVLYAPDMRRCMVLVGNVSD